MKEKAQRSEHMHLQALVLSPAWLRDGEESLPLAWCPVKDHQMPLHIALKPDIVIFSCHQPSLLSLCMGTTIESCGKQKQLEKIHPGADDCRKEATRVS